MCGVVAVVGRQGQPVPLEMVEAATAALVHRGPDDDGIYVRDNVAFGFRRLAIIDLSGAARQPMSSADEDLTIVFNGEIYNYVELRAELIGLGHAFRSSSDTEVLLAAYRQWGPDCVDRFNGMWAFVIHDRRNLTLFGARDRLGVKPLYMWGSASWLVLASEPRAIGATGLTSLKPDWARVADAIAWKLMDHDSGSCMADIRQIPAGCRFWVNATGALKHEPYWDLPAEPRSGNRRPTQAWIEELAALVTDAMRLRLRSDVPVGFTLSGGLDSSLLICEAARLEADHPSLSAFSYQDRQFDEREPIHDTVVQTGAHLEFITEAALDVVDLLPELIRAHGEPIHSLAAMANYALFGLARRHGVKVVLGGQGADEVFGGYSSFQWDYWHSLADDRRFGALISDVRAYAKLHGGSSVATLLSSLRRSLRIALASTATYQRLRARTSAAPPRTATNVLFTPELLSQATRPSIVGAGYRAAAMQRRSLSFWPLPMYLRIEDRSSMAHSVEARLPFTDYRLVEHALRMPDELKHAGGLNKVALRRVAAPLVPRSVVSRVQKLGFPVRAHAGTQAGLHRLCADLTASQAFKERGIYDPGAVQRLLDAARGAESPELVDTLFHLAQTELWLRDLSAVSTTARCRLAA